jgi:hypothetical protein
VKGKPHPSNGSVYALPAGRGNASPVNGFRGGQHH